jgi:hypothetical protein
MDAAHVAPGLERSSEEKDKILPRRVATQELPLMLASFSDSYSFHRT